MFFPKQFMTKTYKEFRENILFEREKALMPATQPLVEKAKKIKAAEKIKEHFQRENTKVWNEIIRINGMGKTDFCLTYNHQFIDDLDYRLAKLEKARPLQLEHARLAMEASLADATIKTISNTVVAQRANFVRACPAGDCRGFLSTAWKCGLCDVWVCSKCHEIKGHTKDADHTCNPDNVATAEALAKDTKPCPKCAASIFKIDGCDQMFCMNCKTPFSWRTGRIETGRIHNPHYYEYMRARGNLQREEGDVPCGGLPDARPIITMFASHRVERAKSDLVLAIHRAHGHIEHVVLPRYHFNRHQCNEDLRVQYMLGEINEERFKSQIQKREKALLKKGEIAGVLTTHNAITADLMRAMDVTTVDKFLAEMTELAKFTNSALEKIGKHYTCVVPKVSEKEYYIT
jgi:hypothetical protein